MMRPLLWGLWILLTVSPGLSLADEPKSREYEFDYQVTLTHLPSSAKELRVWVPYLAQTPYQVIQEVRIEPLEFATITLEKAYQNRIINYVIPLSQTSTVAMNIHYDVKRLEYINRPGGRETPLPVLGREDLTKYLTPNRLVTVSPRIKQMAAQITSDQKTTLDKARALYDYVFENVAYDKTVSGWGQGDTERVCIVKAGNCTDFHSLFISLARSIGIPAQFVIGVPVAAEGQGQIKGYHCWAEFYDEHLGWVPVDISEAWKEKGKKDYYFGGINENRLEFSRGRDIILEPPQEGEPLNYFVYPYAEVDGKPFSGVEVTFQYKEKRPKTMMSSGNTTHQVGI